MAKRNIFAELKDYGIISPPNIKLDSIVYDFESLLPEANECDVPKNCDIRHIPISFSIHSNILENPIFKLSSGISETDIEDLIDDFVDNLLDLSKQIYTSLKNDCMYMFDKLEQLACDEKKYAEKSYFDVLSKRLDRYLKATPAMAFNSQSYDIPLVKKYLIPALKNKSSISGVIKRNSAFMAIFTPELKFVDTKSYLAAGVSLNKFVTAYTGKKDQKLSFPYDYLNSHQKLFDTQLPPKKAFDNKLKYTKITDEEYRSCEELWERKNMTYLWHYLQAYNNSDVEIYLEAINIQSQIYLDEYNINLFRDAISIPDIATSICFSHAPENMTPMFIPSEKTYNELKASIIGGPSLVFSRYHNVEEKTPLSNKHSECVGSVVSKDSNSMYLTESSKELPIGPAFIREAINNFKPQCEYRGRQFSNTSMQWLYWQEHLLGEPIIKGFRELVVLNRKVDGICGNHIFQFQGCYYHGCESCYDRTRMHPQKEKTFGEIYDDTMLFLQQLKNLGYIIHTTFECEFKLAKKENLQLRKFIDTLPKNYTPSTKIKTQQDVLDAVKNKTLRGFIKADIEVPEHLKAYYAGFEPIFKKLKICRDNLSGVMADYCYKNKCLTRPQETIITSFFAKQYLASTDLYVYYMERGFEISNVTLVLEYEFGAPFKTFADKIVSVRREAEKIDAQKPIANSMKLVGNTPYGKSISNVDNYSSVSFVNKKKAQQQITKVGFKHLTELGPDLYELDTMKTNLKYILPTSFGVYVYSNAKLRLIKYVDYLRDHLDPNKYVYVYCDTDSVFVASSENCMEKCVLPGMESSFFSQYENYNVPPFCPLHKQMWIRSMTEGELFVQPPCCYNNEQFHNKTLGLFKTEQVFKQITVLNSKAYYGIGFYEVHSGDDIWKDGDSKFSSKGLNKTSKESLDKSKSNYKKDVLTFENYRKALFDKRQIGGINKGFKSTLPGGMFTYSQFKKGLNFLYPKRHVCDDYVSTEPLNL